MKIHKKKVYFAAVEYLPSRGGIARYSADVVHLLAGEFDVVLFLNNPLSQGAIPRINNVSVKVTHLPREVFWRKVQKKISRDRPVAIFVNHVNLLSIPTGIWSYLNKIPVYTFIYGADVSLPMSFRDYCRICICLRICYIVTISQSSDEKLKRRFPLVKTRRLHPGISEEQIVNEPPPFQARKGVLWIGRLIPRKGADTLIRTFSAIAHQIPEENLTIIGTGPSLAFLQELIKELNLSKRVTIKLDENDESVCDALMNAKVFCQLSREEPNGDVEGFGIVFLEAAAYGVPSVAGASGGVVDAVKDKISGLLVDPLDEASISQCLLKLLKSEKEWETLSSGAQKWAKTFTWNNRKVAHYFPEICED